MLTVQAATISFLISNMAYENSFASVYDVFTDGVDYKTRAGYICSMLSDYGISEGTVLDVACGTGSLSEQLLIKGFEVVATDISVNMLGIAKEKLAPFGDRVLLLCQDMCELDLYGTVDAAVCCLDSINHLIDEEDVDAAFSSIGLFIRPGGVFAFDVNTVYKHTDILSDKTFVYEDDDNTFLVWQNSPCDEENIVEMYIDIFTEDENGKYSRQTDFIAERAYSTEFIINSLENNGFEVLGIFGDIKTEKPADNEERMYFFARKK